jgi:hypothetical protein
MTKILFHNEACNRLPIPLMVMIQDFVQLGDRHCILKNNVASLICNNVVLTIFIRYRARGLNLSYQQ